MSGLCGLSAQNIESLIITDAHQSTTHLSWYVLREFIHCAILTGKKSLKQNRWMQRPTFTIQTSLLLIAKVLESKKRAFGAIGALLR